MAGGASGTSRVFQKGDREIEIGLHARGDQLAPERASRHGDVAAFSSCEPSEVLFEAWMQTRELPHRHAMIVRSQMWLSMRVISMYERRHRTPILLTLAF